MSEATSDVTLDAASFRDPSGAIFTHNDKLYRSVDAKYKEHYDALMDGLYQELIDENLLIEHKEVALVSGLPKSTYKVIQPTYIPFISYPYEWSFSQLQDAALLTLKVQRIAMKHGMNLKDASAYNVQFLNGQPIFIDSLSFETYKPVPWVAYKQFCQHFLAPLALMCHTDLRLQDLLQTNIDGIPLDLASTLLPTKTKLQPGLLMHIHLHGRSQVSHASDGAVAAQGKQPKLSTTMSSQALLGLIGSLEGAVKKLKPKGQQTEWASYYVNNNNYVDTAMKHKQELVRQFVQKLKAKTAVDVGANTGLFSMIAADEGAYTLALDIDPLATEGLYRHLNREGDVRQERILPLVNDFTQPSPALGWNNQERKAILDRISVDAVLALAVVHHLAIPSNIPLVKIAEVFAQISKKGLIVEFIPKEDSQVKILLATREDIFTDYTKTGFEAAFSQYFKIKQVEPIKKSKRFLYLMEKK